MQTDSIQHVQHSVRRGGGDGCRGGAALRVEVFACVNDGLFSGEEGFRKRSLIA